MILGSMMVVVGCAVAGISARAATGDDRPLALLGAIGSGMGVVLAGLGGVVILLPGFLA